MHSIKERARLLAIADMLGHSVWSLALPSAIVCHCMFHGASAPPRFSGKGTASEAQRNSLQSLSDMEIRDLIYLEASAAAGTVGCSRLRCRMADNERPCYGCD